MCCLIVLKETNEDWFVYIFTLQIASVKQKSTINAVAKEGLSHKTYVSLHLLNKVTCPCLVQAKC